MWCLFCLFCLFFRLLLLLFDRLWVGFVFFGGLGFFFSFFVCFMFYVVVFGEGFCVWGFSWGFFVRVFVGGFSEYQF